MNDEEFEYSPELVGDIERMHWGRDNLRIFNMARNNSPALPILMGKRFGNFDEANEAGEAIHEHLLRRKRYVECNRIYGRVLNELEAWEAKNQKPKLKSQPNKYFDEITK